MNAIANIQPNSIPNAVQKDLDKLKGVVGRVVGSTFYGTLLKQMRDDPLKGTIGHGGRGEEVFAAQLHGIWAEKLGTATKGGVAETLYKRLAQQQRLVSQAALKANGGKNAL